MKSEIKLFIDKGINEIVWLNGKSSRFTDDEISDIESDLKVYFETPKCCTHDEIAGFESDLNQNYTGRDFDEWYDLFCDNILHKYLRQKI